MPADLARAPPASSATSPTCSPRGSRTASSLCSTRAVPGDPARSGATPWPAYPRAPPRGRWPPRGALRRRAGRAAPLLYDDRGGGGPGGAPPRTRCRSPVAVRRLVRRLRRPALRPPLPGRGRPSRARLARGPGSGRPIRRLVVPGGGARAATPLRRLRCRGVTRDAARRPARAGAQASGACADAVYNAPRPGRPTLRLSDQAELFDLLVSSDFSPGCGPSFPPPFAPRCAATPHLCCACSRSTARHAEASSTSRTEDPAEFSNALFFATTCQEKPLPWGRAGRSARRPACNARARRSRRLPARVFSPFGRAAAASTQVGTTLCERWPPTAWRRCRSPARLTRRPSSCPGSMDLRTPIAGARGWLR